MRALIVEHGSNRGGLAAARSLDRAGWTVDVVSSGHSLTVRSRSVRRHESIGYPDEGPDALVDAVRRVGREAGSDIVFPVDETQLLVLSRVREELGALLPYPPHPVLTRATDRLEQAVMAERAGLAPPPTTAGELAGLSEREGPVVVKARTPALRRLDGGWGRFETRIGSARQAAGWISEIQASGVDVIVQDTLQGNLASTTVLTDAGGSLIAQVQQEAVRIWPPGAGTSVRAVTVPIDGELTRRILVFLDALGWRGFAQLQFIVDADGAPHLIDFNPRFYGSLALAIGAGVDFPVIWAASATGRPLPAVPAPRTGVRYHWLGGDLRQSMSRRGIGLLGDLGATIVWGRSAVHPIWALSDPKPAIGGALGLVRRRLPV